MDVMQDRKSVMGHESDVYGQQCALLTYNHDVNSSISCFSKYKFYQLDNYIHYNTRRKINNFRLCHVRHTLQLYLIRVYIELSNTCRRGFRVNYYFFTI